MPSTYAHYRMGMQVRRELGEPDRSVIEQHPDLFMVGLHGPDILFYYKPLSPNPVNQTGYGTHEKSGKDFFARAAGVITSCDPSKRAACFSYVCGVICHFALDVTCHGYVDEKILSSGISHTEIEVEYDRRLLLQDGFDPVRKDLTGHLQQAVQNFSKDAESMQAWEIIASFYPGVNAVQAQKAVKSMISCNNLLLSPSHIKRACINAVLHISGNYETMHGCMVNYEANPDCEDSSRRLGELTLQAKELSLRLIREYRFYVRKRRPLDFIYRYTFGGRLPATQPDSKAG